MEQEAFTFAIDRLLGDPSSFWAGFAVAIYFGPKLFVFAKRKLQGHNGASTTIGAIDHLTKKFTASEDARVALEKSIIEIGTDIKILASQKKNSDERFVDFKDAVNERLTRIEGHMDRCPRRSGKE